MKYESALRTLVDPLLHVKAFERCASNAISLMQSRKAERRESWGNEYPDLTFYIVRRPNSWGLMSIYVMYLRYFDYAYRRGWIPVVDMQTVPSLYNKFNVDPTTNAWELFFEQPGGYRLKDIKHAQNIIISGQDLALANDYLISWNCVENGPALDKWRPLARKFIRYSETSLNYIKNAQKGLFGSCINEDSVLGVYCRGTDYLNMRPVGHPVQPSPEMLMQEASRVVDSTQFNLIYLVTEDWNIYKEFKSKFGEKLISLNVSRYSLTNGYIWEDRDMLNRSSVQNGLEYLASMKILAECGGFIGGLTGGTAALMLMRDKPYFYEHLWNLGRYK